MELLKRPSYKQLKEQLGTSGKKSAETFEEAVKNVADFEDLKKNEDFQFFTATGGTASVILDGAIVFYTWDGKNTVGLDYVVVGPEYAVPENSTTGV